MTVENIANKKPIYIIFDPKKLSVLWLHANNNYTYIYYNTLYKKIIGGYIGI